MTKYDWALLAITYVGVVVVVVTAGWFVVECQRLLAALAGYLQ